LDFPRIAVGWCTTTPASSVFSIVFHAYTHTQKINWRAIICGVFSSLTRTDCHAPIYASLRVEYNRRDLSQSGSASTTAALTVVVSLFFSSLLDNASSLLPCAALLRESFVGASSPRSEEPQTLTASPRRQRRGTNTGYARSNSSWTMPQRCARTRIGMTRATHRCRRCASSR